MNSKYSNGKVSMTLIFDDRRIKENGKYPIRFRVLFDRTAFYITPGYDLTADEFENIDKARKTDLVSKRELIDKQWGIVTNKIEEILSNGEYSHSKLKVQIKGKNLSKVCESIDSMITKFESNDQAGNAKIYRTTKQFVKQYLGEKTTFKNITVKVLDDLQTRALVNIRQSTFSLYMRTLRSVYNTAILNGVINEKDYPFARIEKDKTKFHIKKGTGSHIALNEDQIALIATMDITDNTPALRRSRDLFLLMFHMGGINVGDLLRLKWNNFNSDEIRYMRKKTARTNDIERWITVPVTKTVKKYINSYGSKEMKPNDYIFPFLKNPKNEIEARKQIETFTKNMNDDLKTIASELKLPNFSTMVARHSFATIVKDSGESVSFIKEQLGHASEVTTQNYLKSFQGKKRKSVFEKLENQIKSNQN